MTKLVMACTCIWRNSRRRVETSGGVDRRTGRLTTSNSPDRVNPGDIFPVSDEEYGDLLRAGAIEDVQPDEAVRLRQKGTI